MKNKNLSNLSTYTLLRLIVIIGVYYVGVEVLNAVAEYSFDFEKIKSIEYWITTFYSNLVYFGLFTMFYGGGYKILIKKEDVAIPNKINVIIYGILFVLLQIFLACIKCTYKTSFKYWYILICATAAFPIAFFTYATVIYKTTNNITKAGVLAITGMVFFIVNALLFYFFIDRT